MAPTAQDLQTIRETWALVAPDLKKHGTVLFLRLFEQHPDVQRLFEKIKDVPHDQLATNENFVFHTTRVMETIDHAVKGIDNLPALTVLLKQLGSSHAQYNVKKEYFKIGLRISEF
ncbi:uncharacterized protein TRIADDRAFT_59832 [Trichoplax adhaerens]|uniref:Globin domain-containing protein n=1 Tax=Trichoplax adhaerens TaxID=10228 RepID=B3S6K0_TRIAD|nr:hypothetical protein TRIADDRAFT_59832 [Trichoplax adhaerens]EDV21775.1 hypothetical protein TRIADDRAFT_59832 [Trichoplax adhaerens]|eukprot:XP_002115923.1 hypothetical protein TRIADDRAFT_59832 [Trichoplax adhaerens]